jgi:hypothetical protein
VVCAEEELRDASSRWLSPALLENLVRNYLAALGGGEQVIHDKDLSRENTPFPALDGRDS